MTKGTTSQGPKNDKTHGLCRRCSRKTYHLQHKRCGSCGYPEAKMRRYDGWGCKTRARRGQGTGRMKHLKDVPRKFKNGFRTVNNFKIAIGKTQANGVLTRSKVPRRKLK